MYVREQSFFEMPSLMLRPAGWDRSMIRRHLSGWWFFWDDPKSAYVCFWDDMSLERTSNPVLGNLISKVLCNDVWMMESTFQVMFC